MVWLFIFMSNHTFFRIYKDLFTYDLCFTFPKLIHLLIMYTKAFCTYQEEHHSNSRFNHTNCNTSHGNRQNWRKCDDKDLNHGLQRIRISIVIQCAALSFRSTIRRSSTPIATTPCCPSKYQKLIDSNPENCGTAFCPTTNTKNRDDSIPNTHKTKIGPANSSTMEIEIDATPKPTR